MNENKGNRRWMWHCLVGFALSMWFVYLSIKQINFSLLIQVIVKTNLLYLIPFIGVIALCIWAKGIRWKFLIMPLRSTSLKEVMPSTVIGLALNYILFSYLGELFRIYLYHKETGVSKSSIFGTVFLEKIFDFLVVLFLAGIGFLFANTLPVQFLYIGYITCLLALASVLFVLLLVFQTEKCLGATRALTGWLPFHWQEWIIKHMEQGIRGLHSLHNPWLLLNILLTSFAQWILVAVLIYIMLAAVHIHVPFYAAYITMAALVFGVLLPTGPGQLGLIEYCFIICLDLFGIDHESALAAGLLYHFFLYATVILAGGYYLKHVGGSLALIRKKMKEFDLENEGEAL